ncbi:MAG TPA: hypothetical protein VMD05_02890 [Candidatus Nanoarchaeia archaeon]|nr:hypothetical protein [Candidatus Nanoarchaeia archaeon]
MKPQQTKSQTIVEEFPNAVILDLTPSPEITRICWNTGEQKNCPSCYLSKGCKARD